MTNISDKLREKLSERYLEEQTARCPFCRENELGAGNLKLQFSGFATAAVWCNNCGSRWKEAWSPDSITDVEVGDDVPAEVMIAIAEELEEEP